MEGIFIVPHNPTNNPYNQRKPFLVMLVSNKKNKLLKIRKMKTTERFYKAVTKLYNAFHNGELNAMDCKMCAVGNICDNTVEWEQGLELEKICIHDKTFIVNGESELGNKYQAVGLYCDNDLVFIEDLEFIQK